MTAAPGKPRLLFLACYFPPVNSMGSVRAWNIAKYLSRAGWDVRVVTPAAGIWRESFRSEVEPQPGITRIDTGYRRRLLSPGYTRAADSLPARIAGKAMRFAARKLRIEAESGWVSAARATLSGLRRGDADLVLATASPFGSLFLAEEVAERIGVPCVLDYRDSWTLNPFASTPAPARYAALERRLVRNAAAVTVVSPSMREGFERAYGATNVHVLTNGYDPEELDAAVPMQFEDAAFVYAGNFYVPKIVIDPVFAALSRMTDVQGWTFHYFGGAGELVRAAAERFGITARVRTHGRVPRTTSLAAVKGADAAVVITSVFGNETPADREVVTGKLYEIIGSGTPALLIAPPLCDAVDIAGSAVEHVAGHDIDAMTAFFRNAVRHRGTRYTPPPEHAWPAVASRLDGLLRNLLGTKSSPGERYA